MGLLTNRSVSGQNGNPVVEGSHVGKQFGILLFFSKPINFLSINNFISKSVNKE